MMVFFSKKQAIKYREMCRDRVIKLLDRWHLDAESWLLLATLEEQQEALTKLGEQLTEDVAAIGWGEMLEYYGI